MRGRPPLAIGTYGAIRYQRTPAGWRARAQFRDFDGVTREMERSGRTQGLAARRLKTRCAIERCRLRLAR